MDSKQVNRECFIQTLTNLVNGSCETWDLSPLDIASGLAAVLVNYRKELIDYPPNFVENLFELEWVCRTRCGLS